jgi:hypothetical protein
MSALVPKMSALPPKADIRSAKANVRFGPIADLCLKPNGCRRRLLSGQSHVSKAGFIESVLGKSPLDAQDLFARTVQADDRPCPPRANSGHGVGDAVSEWNHVAIFLSN